MILDHEGGIVISCEFCIRRLYNGYLSTIAGSPDRYGTDDGTGTSAGFMRPQGLAVTHYGLIFVADSRLHRIRGIEKSPFVSERRVVTLAGYSRGYNDATASIAQFDTPMDITLYGTQLYIADSGNGHVRVYNYESQQVTTLVTTHSTGLPFPGITGLVWIESQFIVLCGPSWIGYFSTVNQNVTYLARSPYYSNLPCRIGYIPTRHMVVDSFHDQLEVLAVDGSEFVRSFHQYEGVAPQGFLFLNPDE